MLPVMQQHFRISELGEDSEREGKMGWKNWKGDNLRDNRDAHKILKR